MKWLTAKRKVKVLYAVAALVTTYGAALAATDAEQLQRFKDPNQWGAPAGNLNLHRYSALKDINAGNVSGCRWSGRNRAARCAAMKDSRWSSRMSPASR